MITGSSSMVDRADRDQLDQFRWYVNERFRILMRRMDGDNPPWTDSVELQTHRFCNTFRLCDRGSQEIIRILNSIDLSTTSEIDDLAIAFAYRKSNCSDGWKVAISRFGVPDAKNIADWLRECDRDGVQLSTSRAYNVCNGLPTGSTIVGSLADTVEHILADGTLQRVIGESYQNQISILCGIDRIGPFIAQQTLADYGYGRSGYDRCEDRGITAGPGSIRGLKWLLPDERIVPGEYTNYLITVVHDWLMSGEHPVLTVGEYQHDMTLMDTQNCLCEFDKLNRIRSGKGFRRAYHQSDVREIRELVVPRSWR